LIFSKILLDKYSSICGVITDQSVITPFD